MIGQVVLEGELGAIRSQKLLVWRTHWLSSNAVSKAKFWECAITLVVVEGKRQVLW